MSTYFIKGTDSQQLIVSFGGSMKKFGGIPPFEFLNFLTSFFQNPDKLFVVDHYSERYHKGIQGVSHDIESTATFLKEIIKPYESTIFLGVSAGGYAAILFGSLLEVDHVIAFTPPSLIHKGDVRYTDLCPHINETTQYRVLGDLSVEDIGSSHHISQVRRLHGFPNIVVEERSKVLLVNMRDSGELYEILQPLILL